MPYSDQKSRRYRSGGSWSQADYDAADRAESKEAYENALRQMEVHEMTVREFLSQMEDGALLMLYRRTNKISRYGHTDWERLTKDNLTESELNMIVRRMQEEEEKQRKESQKRYEENRRQAALRLQELHTEIRKDAHLTAGMLEGDFHNVFDMREAYGREEGDWLDSPVDAYISGTGFGEEVKVQSGVKVQVTLSLDLSNSMWHNQIASHAIDACIVTSLALKELEASFPGSFFTETFAFAMREDGKSAEVLRQVYSLKTWSDETSLDGLERLRQSKSWVPTWAGQDTWIAPLLEEIEKWEVENSEPDVVRLDIVLTDGVLEHPTDVRSASVIQERRNGTLMTVLLNFLPEEEWFDVQLPNRCIQHPVQVDNIKGLLRKLLAEFVSVYI